jgi:hypothetical protein
MIADDDVAAFAAPGGEAADAGRVLDQEVTPECSDDACGRAGGGHGGRKRFARGIA